MYKRQPNAIDSDIVQTYLTGEPGSEIRLRRRGFEGGKYVYVHTTKKRISDNEQIETCLLYTSDKLRKYGDSCQTLPYG